MMGQGLQHWLLGEGMFFRKGNRRYQLGIGFHSWLGLQPGINAQLTLLQACPALSHTRVDDVDVMLAGIGLAGGLQVRPPLPFIGKLIPQGNLRHLIVNPRRPTTVDAHLTVARIWVRPHLLPGRKFCPQHADGCPKRNCRPEDPTHAQTPSSICIIRSDQLIGRSILPNC